MGAEMHFVWDGDNVMFGNQTVSRLQTTQRLVWEIDFTNSTKVRSGSATTATESSNVQKIEGEFS